MARSQDPAAFHEVLVNAGHEGHRDQQWSGHALHLIDPLRRMARSQDPAAFHEVLVIAGHEGHRDQQPQTPQPHVSMTGLRISKHHVRSLQVRIETVGRWVWLHAYVIGLEFRE